MTGNGVVISDTINTFTLLSAAERQKVRSAWEAEGIEWVRQFPVKAREVMHDAVTSDKTEGPSS